MAYVFGIITPPTPDDAQLGTTIRTYWTNFARTGNPNHPSRPGHRVPLKWPRFNDATDQRMNFDVQPIVLTHFRRSQCEFWWSVYDAQFAGGSPSGAFIH